MRDDPSATAITYARAAEILGVTASTVRTLVQRGKLARLEVWHHTGYVVEADVLALDRERRHARAQRVDARRTA